MSKKQRITAHVTKDIKEQIKKEAEKQDRSESYIAGKIIEQSFKTK